MKRTLTFIALLVSAFTLDAQDDVKKAAPKKQKRPTMAKTFAYEKSVPKPTYAEVKYGTHKRHVLDFWQAESDKPTPLVLFIHGGGWNNGAKELVTRCVIPKELLDAKISLAAINYRLISHAREEGVTPPVKAPLHDAARALQFLRSKSKEWNIDPQLVAATGSSAGACSSLWLAYHDDLADPSCNDTVARQSTRLKCIAVLGAQTSLDPQQMKKWMPNSTYGAHAYGKANFAQALADREQILPWIKEYSPYELASKDDPPAIIFYSAAPAMGKAQNDPTHSANFGIGLQKHCTTLGIECLINYPGTKDKTYKNATAYLIEKLKS